MRRLRSIAIALFVAAPHIGVAQEADSVWVIRHGTFAGAAVKLDVNLATRRSSKFLRVSKLKGDTRFVGWNPSRLPAGVAFRAGRGISEADSAAFWTILRSMEADLGLRLFEPATLQRDSDPDDVIVIDIRTMTRTEGETLVTWSASGALYDARVFLRSASSLHNARVVTHEMMHALGFGHTSAWASVMNPAGVMSPGRLTVDDVAYAQFAFASRDRSERVDMWERLALAFEREGRTLEPNGEEIDCAIGPVRSERVVPATEDPLRSASCFR